VGANPSLIELSLCSRVKSATLCFILKPQSLVQAEDELSFLEPPPGSAKSFGEEEALHSLEQVAQGGCGCPIPAGIQGQAGCGSGQPGLLVGDPAHSRGLELMSIVGLFNPGHSVILWIEPRACSQRPHLFVCVFWLLAKLTSKTITHQYVHTVTHCWVI